MGKEKHFDLKTPREKSNDQGRRKGMRPTYRGKKGSSIGLLGPPLGRRRENSVGVGNAMLLVEKGV